MSEIEPVDDETVFVDPQMKPIIERMLATMEERGPMGTASPSVMRARFNEDVKSWNEDLPELDEISDKVIETPQGDISVRLYNPDASADTLPCLIFIHGGGWIVGDLDTNERTLRVLAKKSGVRILSVDYPLSPENKFPIGLDACVAVVRWVRDNGREWGLDSDHLAVGGDSAGGNLALATALDLRDAGDDWLKFALLVYAAVSADSNTDSHRRFGNGEFGLASDGMKFFWSQYLTDESERNDPRAVPLLANMKKLPPTYLITAGLDALSDDSHSLEKILQTENVQVEHRIYPGVIHGFFSMARFLDAGEQAVTEAADAMKRALIHTRA